MLNVLLDRAATYLCPVASNFAIVRTLVRGYYPYTPGTGNHADIHEIYLLWPISKPGIPVCELDNSSHSLSDSKRHML